MRTVEINRDVKYNEIGPDDLTYVFGDLHALIVFTEISQVSFNIINHSKKGKTCSQISGYLI